MPVTRSSAIAAKILSDIVFFGIATDPVDADAVEMAAGNEIGEAANEANVVRSLLHAARPPLIANAMTARKITLSPVPLRHPCRPIGLVSPETHPYDLNLGRLHVQPGGGAAPQTGPIAD